MTPRSCLSGNGNEVDSDTTGSQMSNQLTICMQTNILMSWGHDTLNIPHGLPKEFSSDASKQDPSIYKSSEARNSRHLAMERLVQVGSKKVVPPQTRQLTYDKRWNYNFTIT
ncbi:hypothetical protein Tco_0144946 [Tanacetum coccineum]